jgi:hypothetical protein
MTTKTVRTAWAKIFIAGSIETAKQICREECLREGLCVTVDPTSYIYTGGEEEGVVIGFINYPRFESSEIIIYNRACKLAQRLIKEMGQTSASVMTSYRTTWFSNRGE